MRKAKVAALVLMAIVGIPAPAVSEQTDIGIRDLVCKQYEHGIPYDDARQLGRRAFPQLRSLLDDPNSKQCWATAVSSIAVAGMPESFGVLRQFIWERFKGDVDRQTFVALESAVATLGASYADEQGPLIDYLYVHANPKSWQQLPWRYAAHSAEDTESWFSVLCIYGLGCCSDPKAEVALQKLDAKPFDPKQGPRIKAAIRMHKEVANLGLSEYKRRAGARMQSHESGGTK